MFCTCYISQALTKPLQPEYMHVAHSSANTQLKCTENALTVSHFDANSTSIQNVYACVEIKFCFNVISHLSLAYVRSVMTFSSSPLTFSIRPFKFKFLLWLGPLLNLKPQYKTWISPSWIKRADT